MKLFTSLLTAILLLTAVVEVSAENKGNNKVTIAVLDAQKVINGTEAAKRARAILKTETDKSQKKIDKMEKVLVGKQKELKAKQSLLSNEKYLEEETLLRKDFQEFRAKAQAIQEDLDKKNLALRKEITDEIKAVVEAIAKKRDYQLVLAKNMALYSADYIDISDEVLKRVNKKLK